MQGLVKSFPNFCFSHWLLRVPLIVVFAQQGLAKWPISAAEAEAWQLPVLVWSVVVLGELGAAAGLSVGGLLAKYCVSVADLITRFSGITICSIMTGVIWIGQPESILEVILYDHFHVMLWAGGLFFALRGNHET